MIRYFVRRLLYGIILLLLISMLCFGLFELAPGNYVEAVRLDPRVTAQTAAMLRERYGLDQPLPFRYLAWLKSALIGEFGFSFTYDMPVGRLLWPRLRNTLLLTALTAFFAWPAALLIGVGATVSRRAGIRHLIMFAMSVLISLPELLVALSLLMLTLRTGSFPIAGNTASSLLERLIAPNAAHLALTVAALVLVSLPVLVRHTEAALREALQSPFIQAARAHGIPRYRLLFAYALPAAANPLISIFGLSIGTLLSGSLVIEVVMSWPGLGPLALDAVLSRDIPIVMATTLLSGAMFVLGNMVADFLLYATDPRIRQL
jgi:peptide/nickel transport system permease protein